MVATEAEWMERAAAFLKHKLREGEVTYTERGRVLINRG